MFELSNIHMAYLYRHIRLDKNEPFYIGIGKDDGGKFKRAHSKVGRSIWWKRVIAKTKYEVEIMIMDITYPEAEEKEKEFIKLYGRGSDGGILVNITTGGIGHTGMFGPLNPKYGVVVSEETKAKCRISYQKTMLNHPKNHDKKASTKKEKKVSPVWAHTGDDGLRRYRESRIKLQKPVLAFDVYGRFVMVFKSLAEASKETGIGRGNISNSCKKRGGRYKTYKGLIWEYKDNVSPDWIKTWTEVKPFENSELPKEAFITAPKVNLIH